MWTFRLNSEEYLESHLSHVYFWASSESVLCFFRCFLRLPFWVKSFPQILHLKGFSLVWILKWSTIFQVFTNSLFQSSYLQMMSLLERLLSGLYSNLSSYWCPLRGSVSWLESSDGLFLLFLVFFFGFLVLSGTRLLISQRNFRWGQSKAWSLRLEPLNYWRWSGRRLCQGLG